MSSFHADDSTLSYRLLLLLSLLDSRGGSALYQAGRGSRLWEHVALCPRQLPTEQASGFASPPTASSLLGRFLDEVQSHSNVNKMSVQNLATVFGPNILRPQIEDPVTIMEGDWMFVWLCGRACVPTCTCKTSLVPVPEPFAPESMGSQAQTLLVAQGCETWGS